MPGSISPAANSIMRVNILAPAASLAMFGCLLEAMREKGHETRLYESAEALAADKEGNAEADALASVPQLALPQCIYEAPRLRVIASALTGIENVDLARATASGIAVANGQVAESVVSMAEATFLMILAALYDINRTQAVLRDNLPRPRERRARMLKGKTVGLIGYGGIARELQARLIPWSVELLVHARRPETVEPPAVGVVLDDLVERSDVLVVLTALSGETRGLLNAERLGRTRERVVVVNTARGPVIDEDALTATAAGRPDMRLALDVFEHEPLALDSPLRQIPGAILTPHMIGHTEETTARVPVVLAENIASALEGRLPEYLCNPDVSAFWLSRFVGAER